MRSARILALALGALCAALALTFARPHATPGPALRDFESYYAAGTQWVKGGSPYTTAIWDAERTIPGVNPHRYELLPYVGIPQALPVFGALSRVSYPAAAAVWLTVLICAAAALVWAVIALLDLRLGVLGIAGVALFALGFGPLTSDLALGQVALLSAAAVALAALGLLRGRTLAGGLAVFAAAIQPNAALALVSQATARRPLLAMAAAFATFLFSFGLAQRGQALSLPAYLALLREHGAAEAFATIQFTTTAIVSSLGVSHGAASLAGWLGPAVSVALWLAGMRALRSDAVLALGFTCAMLPFALPFFHEHDFVIVLIAALVCARRVPSRLWPAALIGALLVSIDWLGLAQRPDGVLQSALLASAAAIGYTCFARRSLATLAWAATPLLLVVACGIAAQNQPAPVWPDAMRPLPPFAPGATAAHVWGTELLYSGLLLPNPFWAALRSLSLLGCAVLAYLSWKSLADSKRSSTGQVLFRENHR